MDTIYYKGTMYPAGRSIEGKMLWCLMQRLSLFQIAILHLFHAIKLRPEDYLIFEEGSRNPDIQYFLVMDAKGIYFSYPQGFHGELRRFD